MAQDGFISITISTDLWKILNAQKEAGESWENLLRRKLKLNPLKEFIRDKGLREVKKFVIKE